MQQTVPSSRTRLVLPSEYVAGALLITFPPSSHWNSTSRSDIMKFRGKEGREEGREDVDGPVYAVRCSLGISMASSSASFRHAPRRRAFFEMGI